MSRAFRREMVSERKATSTRLEPKASFPAEASHVLQCHLRVLTDTRTSRYLQSGPSSSGLRSTPKSISTPFKIDAAVKSTSDMASPELPSPTLGRIVPPIPHLAPQSPKRRREEPMATSRGFHRRAIQPPNSRTEKIGFLHLPDHVRKQIYELAVYDHDRGAVFIPRALPRKVLPEIDDVDICYTTSTGDTEEDKSSLDQPLCCEPISVDGSAAAGRWIEQEDLQQATCLSLGLSRAAVATMTDQELLDVLDNVEPTVDNMADDASIFTALKSEPSTERTSSSDDSDSELSCCRLECGGCCGGCKCFCHFSTLPSDLDEDELPEESDDEDTRNIGSDVLDFILGFTLERASHCDCGDADCVICYDLPIHFEDAYSPKDNVLAMGELGEGDDIEHFDSSELVGMLYETKEPGILLASKEIREQCLPIYYAHNSFSWRFDWTQYFHSCYRFKHWAKSISEDNVKLLTRITFQGRHVVEEGVDFSIDIDLFDEYPFFETSIYTGEDAEIADIIHRDMASYLWLMVQSVRTRPLLSVGHLCELANIFVQGMHRDAGGCTSDAASTCRRILSPLF